MIQTVFASLAGITVSLPEVSIDGTADPEGEGFGAHLNLSTNMKGLLSSCSFKARNPKTNLYAFSCSITAVRETATLSLNKVHLGPGLYFKLLAPGMVPQQLKTSPA